MSCGARNRYPVWEVIDCFRCAKRAVGEVSFDYIRQVGRATKQGTRDPERGTRKAEGETRHAQPGIRIRNPESATLNQNPRCDKSASILVPRLY